MVALATMFFVAPDKQYLSYINWSVLVILFSLMTSVSLMSQANLFAEIAIKFSSWFYSIRWISLVIVDITFILAMLVTNDAILLTLVPFTIVITKQLGEEEHAVTIIIFQTLAANLGSAFTPMGNPQNIYLFGYYGLSFQTFVAGMLPIMILSFLILSFGCFFLIPNRFVHPIMVKPELDKKRLMIALLIFITTLLLILRIIPGIIALSISILLILVFYPKAVTKIDYGLLLTFVMFFIISGNLSRMPLLVSLADKFMTSGWYVYSTGIIFSQFMSNVPAAILLSTFTKPEWWEYLALGVDIGAAGTLVASLANLISYKFVLKSFPEKAGLFIKKSVFWGMILMILLTVMVILTI